LSATVITARRSPSSGSASAISEPSRIESAVAVSVESVIGIGQKMPRGRAHFGAHAQVVGAVHEAVERREPADAEHDEVAPLARAHAHPRKRQRAPAFRGERLAGKHEGFEEASAVRRYECRHRRDCSRVRTFGKA
jgi:hypothetical protein